MQELYRDQNLQIFYKNQKKRVLDTTGIFKSSDFVWTGNAVYAFLVQHDDNNTMLPMEQWYWIAEYDTIYEYNRNNEPIAVWASETPFNGYTRHEWEEYFNGVE